MDMMKRLAALSLAAVMALSALTGCGGGDGSSSSAGSAGSSAAGDAVQSIDPTGISDPYLATAGLAGDTVVATVDQLEITAADLLYWANYGADMYLYQMGGYADDLPWDTAGEDGVTMAESMKRQALEAAAFYTLLPEKAAALGLSVSPSLEQTVQQQLAQLVQQVGSQELVEYVLWSQMLTEDLFLLLNQRSDLHAQLQDLYFGPESDAYPTDAEVQAFAQDELGLYRAKHILVMTVDPDTRQPLDQDTIAQKKAQADDILAQIQAADDPIAKFDELMNQLSEDPGLAANPDGYIASKGQMVPEFEQAALALKDGEISPVVHSESTGYHIILRLPLDPADFRSTMVATLMQDKTANWLTEAALETTPAYDQIDMASFRKNVKALQAGITAQIQASAPQPEDDQDAGSSAQ